MMRVTRVGFYHIATRSLEDDEKSIYRLYSQMTKILFYIQGYTALCVFLDLVAAIYPEEFSKNTDDPE